MRLRRRVAPADKPAYVSVLVPAEYRPGTLSLRVVFYLLGSESTVVPLVVTRALHLIALAHVSSYLLLCMRIAAMALVFRRYAAVFHFQLVRCILLIHPFFLFRHLYITS